MRGTGDYRGGEPGAAHSSFVSSVGFGTFTTSTRNTAPLSLIHRCGIRAGLSTSMSLPDGLPFIADLHDAFAFQDVEEDIHGGHVPLQRFPGLERDDDCRRMGRVVDLPCIHMVRVRARYNLCYIGNLHDHSTFSRGIYGMRDRSSDRRVSMPVRSMNRAVRSFGFA